MSKMKTWCKRTCQAIRPNQHIRYFVAEAAKVHAAVATVSAILPQHYASAARIADIFDKLGKKASAEYVKDKFPTTPKLRFGELGEILAANYLTDYSPYKTVYKLHTKDHREMAMRGDDILGVWPGSPTGLRFLKGEVKSRATLTAPTIREARAALRASCNRPTPHALAAFADRLNEQGQSSLSDAILQCQYKLGIKLDQVTHLLFTFSGNDPGALLKAELTSYMGKVRQHVVGLQVSDPAVFVRKVYRKALANG